MNAQVTDDFTSYSTTSSGQTLGDNWYVFPGDDGSWGRFGADYTYKNSAYDGADANYVSGYSSNYTKNVWLVLKKQVTGSVTFRSRMYKNSGTLYVTNKVTAVDDGTFTVDKTGAQSYSITTTASSNTYDAGSTATYVAFCLTSDQMRLLDVTYTEASAAEGAVLSVSGFESGSSFDFGTVPACETKTFTLNNLGADELTITSIAVSGDFEITDGSDITSIASMGSASVTVATPDKDASGALTIVSNDENSPYVISLTSTYKVPAPIIVLDPTEIEFGKGN